MGKNDVSIGPVDTNKDHRRKGLSSYAIRKIIETYERQNTQFWYYMRDENEISKRVIEKFGFTAWGEGIRLSGTGILRIEKYY
jgi:predicted GNAT family acetyltransferase